MRERERGGGGGGREKATYYSVRNYRSPSRHWRLTFRVGDHQLRLGRQKKKKRKKEKGKTSSRESFAKKAGRLEASILSSVLPLRFDREWNTDRETPTWYARCYRAVQCRACAAGAFHTCGCKIEKKETKRHHVPIHNSKAIYVFFVAASRKKADRSRADCLPFRFGSIAYETRTARLSPVTCMLGATALCFQPLLFRHVWWRELKATIPARFFRKRRRADRQHELPSE